MKNFRIVKTFFAMLVAVGLLFAMAACGSDDAATTTVPATPAPATQEDVPAEEEAPVEEDAYVDVYQDLQDALAAVSENLYWGDNAWEQIMLADDVPSPEMKYGLLVVPFFPSDLVQRNTRTVSISNGNFEIEVVSAETGLSWFINQDGVITGGN